MTDFNPYEPPKANPAPLVRPGDPAAPCPKCGNDRATRVGFTWWGGALGPAIFHVVQCTRCTGRYNGKTGASLTTVIVVYQVLSLLLAGGVAAYYFLS